MTIHKEVGMIEQGVRQFWEASLAWKRTPGFVENYSVGRLFEVLGPLKTLPKAVKLQTQAKDLAGQIIKGRVRRKKVKKSQVIPLPLSIETNVSGQSKQAA